MENPFPRECALKYQPIRLVAEGGFGAIFEARQIDLDRRVAVKLLHGSQMKDKDLVRRFRNEARITAGLNHPSIVKLLDFGTADGIPWLVYEMLDGENLREYLAVGGPAAIEAMASTTKSFG